MREDPLFDIVLNRGKSDETVVPVRASDLEGAMAAHIRESKTTLFSRYFDAGDEGSVADGAAHYTRALLAGIDRLREGTPNE